MTLIANLVALLGAAIWLTVLMLPWRPWSTRETLDVSLSSGFPREDLSDITVLIPARNEAKVLQITLPALKNQGRGLQVILVDDQSSDETSQVAEEVGGKDLLLVEGKPSPAGWSGKLWALEQGRGHIQTPFTLLLDADIELLPGIVRELRNEMAERNVHLVSLMAALHTETFWEKLSMPAFVYFFKLLYPFRLSNSPTSGVAAAAGGCILIKSKVLEDIGGFASIRGELIDDCALAKRVKNRGYRTWMGLSHSVKSLRAYNSLGIIWKMVARTAFTQLGYSKTILILCTFILLAAFGFPAIGLVVGGLSVKLLSAFSLGAMVLTYLPTLRFYGLSPWWALLMPLTGILYLAMTWTSACRYWAGVTATWKGRTY